MPVENEIAVIYCGTKGLLRDLPIEKVSAFEKLFLEVMNARHRKDVLDPLRAGKLTPEMEEILKKEAEEVVERFKK